MGCLEQLLINSTAESKVNWVTTVNCVQRDHCKPLCPSRTRPLEAKGASLTINSAPLGPYSKTPRDCVQDPRNAQSGGGGGNTFHVFIKLNYGEDDSILEPNPGTPNSHRSSSRTVPDSLNRQMLQPCIPQGCLTHKKLHPAIGPHTYCYCRVPGCRCSLCAR